jgi:hypothetical protein
VGAQEHGGKTCADGLFLPDDAFAGQLTQQSRYTSSTAGPIIVLDHTIHAQTPTTVVSDTLKTGSDVVVVIIFAQLARVAPVRHTATLGVDERVFMLAREARRAEDEAGLPRGRFSRRQIQRARFIIIQLSFTGSRHRYYSAFFVPSLEAAWVDEDATFHACVRGVIFPGLLAHGAHEEILARVDELMLVHWTTVVLP